MHKLRHTPIHFLLKAISSYCTGLKLNCVIMLFTGMAILCKDTIKERISSDTDCIGPVRAEKVLHFNTPQDLQLAAKRMSLSSVRGWNCSLNTIMTRRVFCCLQINDAVFIICQRLVNLHLFTEVTMY